jgi:hypothetical protein
MWQSRLRLVLHALLLRKCSKRACVHERVASRNCRNTAGSPAPSVLTRRLAYERAERRAEGTEAPEADVEADLGNRERCVPKELLGALDAASQEVSVRRLAEGSLEAADEVRVGCTNSISL